MGSVLGLMDGTSVGAGVGDVGAAVGDLVGRVESIVGEEVGTALG